MQRDKINILGRISAILLALIFSISYVASAGQVSVSAESTVVAEKQQSEQATTKKYTTGTAQMIYPVISTAETPVSPESEAVDIIIVSDVILEEADLAEESENSIPAEAVVPTESNDARYQYIMGTDYKAYTMNDAPREYSTDSRARRNMRQITVPVWKMDSSGERYSSSYTFMINKNLYENTKAIFKEIYELEIKFPIKYMVGYTFRKVGGVGLINCPYMSIHTFGCAIDINPGDYDNDYYLGKGNDLRDKTNPYCIPDEVIEIFEKYGWMWGGNFDICSDTMHFQYFELGFLQYSSDEPFPVLSVSNNNNPTYVKNLTQRLVELEYLEIPGTVFTLSVQSAVKAFQRDYGIDCDGVVDYDTWETLINLTHYMDFVF